MSANNFILIDRNNLEVSVRDAEAGVVLEKIGQAKTLEQAITLAQAYQQKEIVEYGIQFTELKKRKNVK